MMRKMLGLRRGNERSRPKQTKFNISTLLELSSLINLQYFDIHLLQSRCLGTLFIAYMDDIAYIVDSIDYISDTRHNSNNLRVQLPSHLQRNIMRIPDLAGENIATISCLLKCMFAWPVVMATLYPNMTSFKYFGAAWIIIDT